MCPFITLIVAWIATLQCGGRSTCQEHVSAPVSCKCCREVRRFPDTLKRGNAEKYCCDALVNARMYLMVMMMVVVMMMMMMCKLSFRIISATKS
jgi:hypothetical protein